jgi:hypothetical protein
MVSTNDKNQKSRKPAENYRERAGAVIKRMLVDVKAFVDPDKWKEPTPELTEGFIDEFHSIMNWASEGARKQGFPTPYFTGPLTEEEMRFVERRFLRR